MCRAMDMITEMASEIKMDIALAGMLALVPVAVVGSWWVGALVFGIGVMWVLRPKQV